MRNTLGLDSDPAPNKLVRGLEASFGVKFSNSEAEAFRTVGDIFELLKLRFAVDGNPNRACATAMAFYRLRRALKSAGVRLAMTPSSKLDEASTLSPNLLFRRLRKGTPLRLPNLRFGPLGIAGRCVMHLTILTSIALAFVDFRAARVCLAFAPIGAALVYVDGRKFPRGCRTLGDLARKVAGLNFGCLVILGALPRQNDLWCALLEVITEHTHIPRVEITPNTFFLQNEKYAA